jgi:hypothetical protein
MFLRDTSTITMRMKRAGIDIFGTFSCLINPVYEIFYRWKYKTLLSYVIHSITPPMSPVYLSPLPSLHPFPKSLPCSRNTHKFTVTYACHPNSALANNYVSTVISS